MNYLDDTEYDDTIIDEDNEPTVVTHLARIDVTQEWLKGSFDETYTTPQDDGLFETTTVTLVKQQVFRARTVRPFV